jgi:DNA invertase Pin-like site-specific DNA recombinase
VLKNLKSTHFCTIWRVQPLQDDDTADLLSPVPAVRTGGLVGYARVSTKGQLLDRQIHALTEAGCIRIFADKKSGKNAEREELRKALDYLREGDTLVVPSLDRLGRSIQDLIAIVSGLRKRGIGFTSLHEALDTTTPGGRLVFHVFAALAEFIRELIVQGTNEGLDAARARGARLGRPAGLDRRTGTSRTRPARPPGEHRHLDREAPRRLPQHHLQLPARTEGRSSHAR